MKHFFHEKFQFHKETGSNLWHEKKHWQLLFHLLWWLAIIKQNKMCSLQQTPIFNNGIFPKFIEQKTKKIRFWSKIKIWKKKFGFCQLWSPKIPDHGHWKNYFFQVLIFDQKRIFLVFCSINLGKMLLFENGCLLQRTHVKM